MVKRIREAATGGGLAADVERRLQARIKSRRDEILTERRNLSAQIAKLSAEGRRLVEKIGEANGAAASLLDQRIAEVGDQLGRAEHRLAEVERAIEALDHAEVETKWVLQALADFDAVWDVLTAENRARLVRALVRRDEVDEPSGAVTAVLADLGLTTSVRRDGDDPGEIHHAGVGHTEPATSEACA